MNDVMTASALEEIESAFEGNLSKACTSEAKPLCTNEGCPCYNRRCPLQ